MVTVKSLLLWLVLVAAVVVSATLFVLNSESASVAVEQFVRPGPLSSGHANLGGQCTSCHEPTVGVTVAKCTVCHANAEKLLGRQPTAFHESVEECSVCHLEHQTANIRSRVMDHVELAKIGARTLARAASRDSEADAESDATLKSLKIWLSIRSPNQFDANRARESLNCAGCHDRQDPHLQRFGGDCAQCHDFDSWTIASFEHPSSSSKECVQCHRPPPSHLMEHFSMVSRQFAGKQEARVEQCFECHNTTGWNDIVNVGYYKHH